MTRASACATHERNGSHAREREQQRRIDGYRPRRARKFRKQPEAGHWLDAADFAAMPQFPDGAARHRPYGPRRLKQRRNPETE
jgi:hypothetical protein